MIHTQSQREAELADHAGKQVHCISPYVNPAHVLAPPRRWLEALVNGEYSWPFFRLRYKNLLRTRYKAEPQRFHALLDAALAGPHLVLTCHCMTDRCHRELARDFLERLREMPGAAPAATAVATEERAETNTHARTNPATGAAREPKAAPVRRIPPAREWAHGRNPGLALATLIEHPQAALHP